MGGLRPHFGCSGGIAKLLWSDSDIVFFSLLCARVIRCGQIRTRCSGLIDLSPKTNRLHFEPIQEKAAQVLWVDHVPKLTKEAGLRPQQPKVWRTLPRPTWLYDDQVGNFLWGAPRLPALGVGPSTTKFWDLPRNIRVYV